MLSSLVQRHDHVFSSLFAFDEPSGGLLLRLFCGTLTRTRHATSPFLPGSEIFDTILRSAVLSELWMQTSRPQDMYV